MDANSSEEVKCPACGRPLQEQGQLGFGAVASAFWPRRSKLRSCCEHASVLNSLRRGMQPRPPPTRHGVRVLALDGGGTRGLVTIAMLKELERVSGRRVQELFDVIGGTSTGGLLALGLQEGYSLTQLEEHYHTLAAEVFRTPWREGRDGHARAAGLGNLLVTGATYKAHSLESVFKKLLGQAKPMLDRRAEQEVSFRAAQEASQAMPAADTRPPPPPPPPNAFVIACLASQTPLAPYLFRNYELRDDVVEPHAVVEPLQGTSEAAAWEALRATTAAPSFFAAFALGERVFIDGALLANNPAAVALSEARALYPGEPIACLASFGTGEFPQGELSGREVGSWSHTVKGLVAAATRTEEVHATLSGLLRPNVPYFRFNPRIPASPLDETCTHKLKALQEVGQSFMSPGGGGARDCEALSSVLRKASSPPWGQRRWPSLNRAAISGILRSKITRGTLSRL